MDGEELEAALTKLRPTERLTVGEVSLVVAHHARGEVEVTKPDGDTVQAVRTPALVTGPTETLLEIAHDHWGDGGLVSCLTRGDSAPDFDRLVHGLRLGVAPSPSLGLDMCEARLLEWDPASRWGNVKQASTTELDDVAAGSALDLLAPCGVVGWGTRSKLFEDVGRRRNFVAATFAWSAAAAPMCVYVLTRVLPILRALPPVGSKSEVR